MIVQIHIHPKVEKLLDQMEHLGKAPSIAAKRARRIIRSLLKGASPSHAGRLSRRKDARIENLFKFDLGSGFRLICIKWKKCLHILYVGSHDHCDAWLTANSRKKPHETAVRMNIYTAAATAESVRAEDVPDEEPDFFPIMPVTQQELRIVFKGLTG